MAMADPGSAAETSAPRALARVLGASRDGSVIADSSRGLLVTVMGEFVLASGGATWTQSAIALMELLGVQQKATRQALARMEKQEWLKRDRIGRHTRWILTDAFAGLLAEGAERIYGFGTGSRTWDGRWLIVQASVPERDRKIRYRMAQGLSWAGFGSLGPGLWISPWVDQESVVTALLEELSVPARSFRADLGELGSGSDLVAEAWDLADVAVRYEQFLVSADELAGAPVSELDGGIAAAHLAELVHRWRRFPFVDPDLPRQLLPDDWPRPRAAQRFTEIRSALLPPARTWWDQLEFGSGS